MTGCKRRGFVVLTALAALLLLMVAAALFLHFGILGLRQEHMQNLSAQCDQIVLSLRDLSRREGAKPAGKMREIAIGELLPPGAQGSAWLGFEDRPAGGKTVLCRVEIELGRDRIRRSYEWQSE